MRLLCVHPGASWATADLFTGLYPALKRHGVETVEYALDGRIAFAGSWLSALYRRNKAGGMPKPTMADTLYLAEQGILERAFRFGVDWVLVIAGTYVLPDVYDLMRRAGLRVAVLLTESPYDMANEIEIAKRVNLVFTNERTAVPIFAEHCPAYYYQHAIDPAKHDPAGDDDDTVATHDVVFVGTGWPERIELLSAIDWTGIDLGLYGMWSMLGSRHRLRRHLRGNIVPNETTAALYRRAKIGLNLHRASVDFTRDSARIAGAESMNPRCYELAACGRFFITDARPEVAEVFGDAVPTFETPEELERLIRHYLAHDAERERIAARLPGMVAGHNFYERARQIVSVLQQER